MSYQVLRVKKIKSISAMSAILSEQHRADMKLCKRADPSQEIRNDYSDNFKNTMQKFKEMLPTKVRKNAVYGLNIVCGASPKFFSKRQFDQKDFFDDCKDFFNSRFGGEKNCIGWAVHKDEATPHMQLVYIPLVDGKLNARKLIGGTKYELSKLQTDFFESVGIKYGLEKPIPKRETHKIHQTAEQWERKHIEIEREQEQKKIELEKKQEIIEKAEQYFRERAKKKTDLMSEIFQDIGLEEEEDEDKIEIPEPKIFEKAKEFYKRISPVFLQLKKLVKKLKDEILKKDEKIKEQSDTIKKAFVKFDDYEKKINLQNEKIKKYENETLEDFQKRYFLKNRQKSKGFEIGD